MTSKKQKKGKTMALTDFLANDSKLVTVRATNWSDIVDSEDTETKPIGNHLINQIYSCFFSF